jgi:hypothetical protein
VKSGWRSDPTKAIAARDDMSVSDIEPTLEAMMPGQEGLFYARRTEHGWDITGPASTDD